MKVSIRSVGLTAALVLLGGYASQAGAAIISTSTVLWETSSYEGGDAGLPFSFSLQSSQLIIAYQVGATDYMLSGTILTVTAMASKTSTRLSFIDLIYMQTYAFTNTTDQAVQIYIEDDYGYDGSGINFAANSGLAILTAAFLHPVFGWSDEQFFACTSALTCDQLGDTEESNGFDGSPGSYYISSRWDEAQNSNVAPGETFSFNIGGRVSALAFVPVPEPSTLALLGFGLLGMGFARRRKTH